MSFYKKRQVLITVLFLSGCLTGLAQRPENILEQWSGRSPIEKVYLHFDRENYIAGETAWFKAYLYSDFFPDTISTTLYVELYNDSSVMISRKILPVLLSNTNGGFELPDSLETGYYFIKAYSPTMFNRDPGFILQQNIFVSGKKKNSDATAIQKQKELRLEFFPEAGNFIAGSLNTVAFKATHENGLPATVSGSVKNEKDEVLATFTTYHDGMGMFDLTPLPNEKYYAVINEDATSHKYYLPGQTDKGIVFKIISSGGSKYFELLQPVKDPSFKAAYMIGQMQHHIVFRQNFLPGKENITGTIDISHLSSGILQVTVFNKDDIPLAERLTFVDNGEYIQHAELVADTVNFSERGKNVFHVSLKDTVVGFFSVAVTDPDYDLHAIRQQNILSALLLTADLKGYVHNPAYYFSDNSDSVQNARDLVMMVNGWRRFKWSSLSYNNLLPVDKDAGYITVDGHLYLKDTKKPFADKPFVVFIYGPDSSRAVRMSSTDSHGYFKMDSLLFFGRSRLLFKDIRGKKSDLLQVKLSDDSLAKKFQIPRVDQQNFYRSISPDGNKEKKWGYDYEAISRAKGLMLEAVTVKAKKKNQVEELEEKYTSGLFSGLSERTIDLVNTNEPINQENIFEYLSYRVPGLSVNRDGIDYSIYYRQGLGTASSMGLIPMTLYLDEIETDASFISSIPANQIAMVKVYSSFVGAVGNGAGGVLAIYTKKGTDLYNPATMTDMVRYQGYSVIKEFYSPDYSVNTTAIKKPDNRITLFWSPQIIVNNVNGYFPVRFYNNDRTKQFKIVVEGMTLDGKLLMIEKTFERKAF